MQSPSASLVKGKHSVSKIIFISSILLFGIIFLFFYATSGYGKCSLGQSLALKGSRAEQCVAFGTIVDPTLANQRTIRITKTTWSGWTSAQATPVTQDILLDSNTEVIQLYGFSSSEMYRLSVKSFDDNLVSLSVEDLSLKQNTSIQQTGVNLTDCGAHDFEVNRGGKIELDTCTLDAGVTWSLEYL